MVKQGDRLMDETTASKISLRFGKKRLNSAQLSLQRAIAGKGGDELLHGQVEEALEHIREARRMVQNEGAANEQTTVWIL
jgi:hypothetical protein